MSTFWIRAIQLILSLSFLVVIHELGHFTFAKIFKVRVEKFYMFFNPYFSLLRLKKVNGKWRIRFFAPNVEPSMVEKKDENGQTVTDRKGNPVYRPMTQDELNQLSEDDWRRYPENTEWGIGWLPLGGYCSISGMVDETTTSGELASEPQPWEYRSRPAWQRLPIIIGGVLVNFIAALVIFSAVMYHWGEEYLTLDSAKYGFEYAEVMHNEGLQDGDFILTINGEVPETPADIIQMTLIDGKRELKVLKANGDTATLVLSEDFDQKVLQTGTGHIMQYRIPFIINEIMDGSPASQAGLQQGDRIIAVGDTATLYYKDVTATLPRYACDSVSLTYLREADTLTCRAFLGDEAKLGVAVETTLTLLPTKKVTYTFFEAIPAGISKGWNTLVSYVKQFKLVFTKQGAKSVGGFGAIGSMFPPVWNWYSFWYMTAFLSIILAFMNIIPIPALDGGYVLFILVEILTGKKPSDRFLEIVNSIGFYLLLALVLYANFNDIIKQFF